MMVTPEVLFNAAACQRPAASCPPVQTERYRAVICPGQTRCTVCSKREGAGMRDRCA